jgi:hypothetical protein
MTPVQFLEMLRFGIPGYQIQAFSPECLSAKVKWCGEMMEVTAIDVDAYPVLIVTTPDLRLTERTTAVLGLLDSVLPEVMQRPSPWPDCQSLVERIRELAEEEDDDVDPA